MFARQAVRKFSEIISRNSYCVMIDPLNGGKALYVSGLVNLGEVRSVVEGLKCDYSIHQWCFDGSQGAHCLVISKGPCKVLGNQQLYASMRKSTMKKLPE